MNKASLLFPGLRTETPVELPGEPRKFTGNGSGLLPIPGCDSVAMVLINGVELPGVISQKFPTDLAAKEHVSQTSPLYDLVEDAEGIPCLARHYQSNDGIWQDGATITVVGTWAPDPAETLPSGRTPLVQQVVDGITGLINKQGEGS